MPCQTKFINYIDVFWRDYVRVKNYEDTTRSDTRCDNLAAWPRHVNVKRNFLEDESFHENIPLAGYGYRKSKLATLEFLSFCVTRHLHDGQEAVMLVKKVTYFG